jgi:hypothetical protein
VPLDELAFPIDIIDRAVGTAVKARLNWVLLAELPVNPGNPFNAVAEYIGLWVEVDWVASPLPPAGTHGDTPLDPSKVTPWVGSYQAMRDGKLNGVHAGAPGRFGGYVEGIALDMLP